MLHQLHVSCQALPRCAAATQTRTSKERIAAAWNPACLSKGHDSKHTNCATVHYIHLPRKRMQSLQQSSSPDTADMIVEELVLAWML